MSPEAMRVAIAEACGWTEVRPAECVAGQFSGIPPDRPGKSRIRDWIPNYPADLNAINEAVSHCLIADSQWARYGHWLQEVTRWHCVGIVPDYSRDLASLARVANATASQRAEAFLRTIGKWEPSP